MNSNGRLGQLTISSVDTTGNVAGTFFGHPITGFWDEVTQKLSFTANGPPFIGAYAGFLFQDQFREPGIQGSTVFTIAGHFIVTTPLGGSADRPTFGWYAQIGAA